MFITESYQAETLRKLVEIYSDNHDEPLYSSEVEYVREIKDGEEIELNVYDFIDEINEQIALDEENAKSDREHNNSFRQPY